MHCTKFGTGNDRYCLNLYNNNEKIKNVYIKVIFDNLKYNSGSYITTINNNKSQYIMPGVLSQNDIGKGKITPFASTNYPTFIQIGNPVVDLSPYETGSTYRRLNLIIYVKDVNMFYYMWQYDLEHIYNKEE